MDLSGENWGIKNKPDGLEQLRDYGRLLQVTACIFLGNKDTFWVSGQLDKSRT